MILFAVKQLSRLPSGYQQPEKQFRFNWFVSAKGLTVFDNFANEFLSKENNFLSPTHIYFNALICQLPC